MAAAAAAAHNTTARRLEPDDSLERNWNWKAASLALEPTLARRGARYHGYPVSAGYFGSFSLDGLALALHAVYHARAFDDALEAAVNHLGDADSTGSIAGQLAGALYGYAAIPRPLLAQLEAWDDGEVTLRGVLLFGARAAAAHAAAEPAAGPAADFEGPGRHFEERHGSEAEEGGS